MKRIADRDPNMGYDEKMSNINKQLDSNLAIDNGGDDWEDMLD